MEKTASPAAPADNIGDLLREFADQTFRDLSRYRFAEEREWYECALFYQRRQWLSWDNQSRRFNQIKPDARKPRPMPVSNYFAKAINAAANQLGSQLPRMLATATSQDDGDRRAADFAEKAKDTIDRESGMVILNPILAKHTALWGIGITKDVYDTSASTGRVSVPQMTVTKMAMRGCKTCGTSWPAQNSTMFQPAAPEQRTSEKCAQCGGSDLDEFERPEIGVDNVMQFSRGKITTEVRTIFEVFLPRDCQNPNLAKRICQRYRKPLGEIRRLFPDKGAAVQAEGVGEIHEIYLEALRSLINYNYLHEQTAEGATLTEVWFDWDELPKTTQETIQEQADPADAEKYEQLGGYVISAGGVTLDYGPNPIEGKKPYTFYLWELDPANTYPKGLGVDLVPLQKRLNRIDSLIELGMMTNAAGKWLWPKTQTTPKPSGTPNEVVEWDPIGDGKTPPTFVQPSPFHPSVWQLRQTILNDFEQLGYMTSVGNPPAGVQAFRALAYLGAKADEQINTQRMLFELGHQLRYEKCLVYARLFWDEPRKCKVAGFNGRYAVESFTREQLQGDYEIEIVPGSSRPRSLAEKQAAFAGLLQAGMVDISDPSVREFVLDMASLEDLDLKDELQILKAHRDLERAKQGVPPTQNPNIKFDIHLQVFANYSLTEEFEGLPPQVQQLILQLCSQYSQALNQARETMAPAPAGAGGNDKAKALAAGVQAMQGSPLQGVPGGNVSPAAAQQGALEEGQQVANQVG